MPVFGFEKKRAEAFKSIRKIGNDIKQKQEEFKHALDHTEADNEEHKEDEGMEDPLTPAEQQIIQIQNQTKHLNNLTLNVSDTNPQYTQNVNSLISGLKVKDSLDFANQ